MKIDIWSKGSHGKGQKNRLTYYVNITSAVWRPHRKGNPQPCDRPDPVARSVRLSPVEDPRGVTTAQARHEGRQARHVGVVLTGRAAAVGVEEDDRCVPNATIQDPHIPDHRIHGTGKGSVCYYVIL